MKVGLIKVPKHVELILHISNHSTNWYDAYGKLHKTKRALTEKQYHCVEEVEHNHGKIAFNQKIEWHCLSAVRSAQLIFVNGWFHKYLLVNLCRPYWPMYIEVTLCAPLRCISSELQCMCLFTKKHYSAGLWCFWTLFMFIDGAWKSPIWRLPIVVYKTKLLATAICAPQLSFWFEFLSNHKKTTCYLGSNVRSDVLHLLRWDRASWNCAGFAREFGLGNSIKLKTLWYN